MSVELESVENLYPFVLTEEQEHLRREIREFAAQEIAPNVMTWDEAGEFPLATVKKLGAMGLLGMIFPPEYGGAGLGYVDYALASSGMYFRRCHSFPARKIWLVPRELCAATVRPSDPSTAESSSIASA